MTNTASAREALNAQKVRTLQFEHVPTGAGCTIAASRGRGHSSCDGLATSPIGRPLCACCDHEWHSFKEPAATRINPRWPLVAG